MRVMASEFAAGNFAPETQLPEDDVAGTDSGYTREQQGDGRNVKQPVDLVDAGQPDARRDEDCHEDKQHSDRTHVKFLLYDSVLVTGAAGGCQTTMPTIFCSRMDA
jgi:hypothetical protein